MLGLLPQTLSRLSNWPSAFVDAFVGREPTQDLKPLCKGYRRQGDGETVSQLIVAVTIMAADGGPIQRPAHALNRAVPFGMLGLCEAVIVIVSCAD
jgi:hypothetical protein